MSRNHALSLASLTILTLLSASVTGELMDLLTLNNAHLVSLGICAGTAATCGFLVMLNELMRRTVA